MNSTVLEVLAIFTLILLNGILAMAELSLVSSRKYRLEQQAGRGNTGARAALRLQEEPTRFLSAIQVGITLIAVFTGVFGGATIAEEIAAWIGRFPALTAYAQPIGLTLVVIVVTYFSIVLGELVPKRIAMSNPEAFAASVARPMQCLARISAPVLSFLNFSTERILRLLHVPTEPKVEEFDDEIRALVREGAQTGQVEHVEREMIERVLRLGDQRVAALMTPRKDILWIDPDDTTDDMVETVVSGHHTVYPVARGDLDHMLGYVRARDILAAALERRPMVLEPLVVPGVFLPASMAALRVLEETKRQHAPIAFLVDEFGGIEGLVTLSDIVRAIFGEFTLAEQAAAPGIVQREDGSFLVDGLMSIEAFHDAVQTTADMDDFSGLYNTVSGFVMAQLGRMPEEGDAFDWQDLRVEVMDMDGLRVDKILVTRRAPEPPAP